MSLRSDTSIVIKPCDKNLGTCVVSRSWYEQEALSQLRNPVAYAELPAPPLLSTILSSLLALLSRHGRLTHPATPTALSPLANFLLQARNKPLRLCRFYMLIKVHKPTLAGRPICSSIACPTYFASQYLDSVLQPLARASPSYVCNSTSFLQRLEQLHLPHDCVFVTADVTNLYPSISHPAGLRALRITLLRHQFPPSEIAFILDLTHWVLSNNFLEFGNLVFHQCQGTAMGTPLAVAYATIYLTIFEEEILAVCHDTCVSFQPPRLYLRFVDDIFAIFTSHTSGQLFLETFTSHDVNIQLTSTISSDEGTFLDVTAYKGPRFASLQVLDTRLFQKPQNRYLYLPPFSFHHPAVFRSFVNNEIRRYRLLCSSDDTFMAALSAFHSRLLARGYSAPFLTPLFASLPSRPSLLAALPTSVPPLPGPPHTDAPTPTSPAPLRPSSAHPLLFALPFSTRSRQLRLSPCLLPPLAVQASPIGLQLFAGTHPKLCFHRAQNLGDLLTSSRYPFSLPPSTRNPAPQGQDQDPVR